MMKISRIQPALPHPERSLRRKMSAKTPMNIQMSMNQKKKTIIAHSTLPNVQSYASTYPSLSLVDGAPEPTVRRRPAHPPGTMGLAYTAATEQGGADVPDPGIARDRARVRLDRAADRRPFARKDRLDPGPDRGLRRLVRGRPARQPDRGRRLRLAAERPDRLDRRGRDRHGRLGPDPRSPGRIALRCPRVVAGSPGSGSAPSCCWAASRRPAVSGCRATRSRPSAWRTTPPTGSASRSEA